MGTFASVTDLKRMRLLCDLRQLDVWAGTGVPVYRISLAERGALQLTESQEKLVLAYLHKRWAALRQVEMDVDTQEKLPLTPTRGGL
jgi:hypothetical protein